MRKRKAFTLVELLVAMAISSVLIATVAVSLFFVLKTSNNVQDSADMNYKARTVRDYILSDTILPNITTTYEFSYDNNAKALKDVAKNKVVVSGALFMKVTFTENGDGFIVCDIEYKANESKETSDMLSFVVKKAE